MINRRNLIGAGVLGVGGATAAFANPSSAPILGAPAITRNRRRFNMVPPGWFEFSKRASVPIVIPARS